MIASPLYFTRPAFQSMEIGKAMDSFLTSWLARHELTEKAQLFHYTTLSGLQGIVKDRALWFGHASSFNDRLEIQYGQDLIAGIIREAMDQEERDDLRNFLQNMLIQVQVFGKSMFETFVACFCESGNLLSQWRAYANSGGGYCLGFEFSPSTRFASDVKNITEGKIPFLRKIIYDEKEQRGMVKDYVERIYEAAKRALDGELSGRFPEMPTHASSVIAFQAADILLDMLISFKHPAFESEKEWRIVRVMMESYQPEYLRFRESLGGLIPYRATNIYDIDDKKELTFPLRTIGFGPILDPVRTRSAMKLLIQSIASDQHPVKLMPHRVNIMGAGYSLRPQ